MDARSRNELDGLIAALASTQFAVFSRGQLIALGGTSTQVAHRLRTGRWERALPNVYRIAGAEVSTRQMAMAAALWAGDGSLASHSTAAVLWGFDGVRIRRPELWTPRKIRSDVVVVHHGTRLDRADRTMLGPIPITTPVRTLIDMAGRLEDQRLSSVLEDLVRRRLVDVERLRARVDALRTSGRTGAGRLASLLRERASGPPMESALETLVWRLIVRSGVTLPRRQHWVTVPGGRYRLDFCWPAQSLALECDSWAHHGERRDDWGKDRERYAELAAVGMRVMPVTWAVARHDPGRVTSWLQTALGHAA